MGMDYPRFVRRQERAGRIPVHIQITQGTSALPGQNKEWAFNTLLLIYFSQVLGLSAALVGIVLAVAIAIDAISDPMVGSLSDNLKSRLGRRHPLIFFSIIPTTLSAFALFSPPPTLSSTELAVWLLGWTVAVRLSFSFYAVPWGALGAELSKDYGERTEVIAYRMMMGVYIGSIWIILMYNFLFPSSQEEQGLLNSQHYPFFAIVLASGLFFWMSLSSLGTLRQIKYLPQPTEKVPRITAKDSADRVFESLKNKNFRLLFIGTLIASAIQGTGQVFDTYMNVFFWEFSTEEIAWFSVAAMVGVTAALLTIRPLQKRFEKRDIFISCLLIGSILQIAKVAARFFEMLPANGDPLLLQIFLVQSSMGAFCAFIFLMMFASMIADISDEQESANGLRQEGVFSGGITFSSKATSGFGAIIGGFLLESVIQMPVGTVPGEVGYPVLVKLAVIDGIIMPALMIVPIMLVRRYSLTKGRVEQIQANLKHAANGQNRSN